jgi:hypothetical protein
MLHDKFDVAKDVNFELEIKTNEDLKIKKIKIILNKSIIIFLPKMIKILLHKKIKIIPLKNQNNPYHNDLASLDIIIHLIIILQDTSYDDPFLSYVIHLARMMKKLASSTKK